LLQRAGGLGLDKHLFLIKLEEVSLSELTPFYKSMLKVWRTVFKVEREIDPQGQWVTEEPLLFNPMIQTRMLSSASIRTSLLRNNVVKLGHLLDRNGWRSAETIREVTGLRSLRLTEKLMEEIFNAIPSSYREIIARKETDEKEFPKIKIAPASKEDLEGEEAGSILFFEFPQIELFESTSKKAIYYITVKVLHQESLRRVKASGWPGLLTKEFLVRDRWRALYKPPVEKRTADLQWRIIHRAIATDRHVAHLNPAVGGECRFCGEQEDLEHLFLKCERLQSLFNLLKEWFRKFDQDFSDKVFIGGLKYSFLMRKKVCLLNYIIGTAKLAVWKTRKNKGLQLASTDPEVMFRKLVEGRLKVEYAYYDIVNDVRSFIEIWCINDVLCTIYDDVMVLNF